MRMTFEYTIRDLQVSSAKHGPCEVCGLPVSDVHLQTEYEVIGGFRLYRGELSLFGHEACLRAKRKEHYRG